MTQRFAYRSMVVLASLFLSAAAIAETWYVDDDNCPGPGDGSACNPFCTIQEAVAVATDGDMILVRDGDYYGPIDLFSKNLELRSVNGAATTFLRGDQLTFERSIIEIDGGQDASTVIQGFTVTGAVQRRDKAITIENSDPTFLNCVVANNGSPSTSLGEGIGGAVVIYNASPSFTDCIFENNTAGHEAGAVRIYTGSEAPPALTTFTCCTFRYNYAGHAGGAVEILNGNEHTDALFDGCLFYGNKGNGKQGYFHGGGGHAVWIGGGGSTFIDCTFRNHSNGYYGPAAVYIENGPSPTTFDGCLFKDNNDSNSRGATAIQSIRTGNWGVPTGEPQDIYMQRCRFENNYGRTAVSGTQEQHWLIKDCQFLNNGSGQGGPGALQLDLIAGQYYGHVYNTLFQGNHSNGYHHGGAASGVGVYWANCLFVDNHSSYDNGPGALAQVRCAVRNCTFYRNTSPNPPYTISQPGVGGNVRNCIVWGTGGDEVYASDVRYCIVSGGYPAGSYIGTADPMFVDPDGPDDDLSTWQDNDFSPLPGSPAIDAATPYELFADTYDLDGDGDVNEWTPIDYAGNPRVVDDPNKADCEAFGGTACGNGPLPDIGAFEGPPGEPLIIDPVAGNGCAPFVSIDSDGDGVPDDADVCEGFDDCLDADGDGTPDGCANRPPLARAGADQTVDEGTFVTLDGSASGDPDGDPLTYTWTRVAGPGVTLNTTDPVHPTFVAPSVAVGGATLTFQLVVNDGQVDSESASVNVTVKNVNHAPVAVAGGDQTVAESSPVTLDGSASYDQDGDELTYSWAQTSGSDVTLTDANTAQPSFTAPFVGAAGETLTFELTVSDGSLSATSTVTVTVENVNHDPVANAGTDQTVDENGAVTLDATGSSDPDGDPLTYQWVQIGGSAVTLSSTSSASPTFTAPEVSATPNETLTFRVTVDDGLGASASDEVVITVLDTNAPPMCDLARPSSNSLWPPNHKLREITITGISDPDNQDVAITILGVTQDEPVNGLGDGDTAPDAVIQGDTVLIRSERAGGGNGRVYTIHFEADDGAGGVCTGSVTVCVPHDRRGGNECIDDGQIYNSVAE